MDYCNQIIGAWPVQDMRTMFKVFEWQIKYSSDNCKEKLKMAMKNVIKETISFCSGIPIL